MSNTYPSFMQEKTSSNISLVLTTAGFLVFSVGQLSSSDIDVAEQSITPSSASFDFSSVQGLQSEPLAQLKGRINDLWHDLAQGELNPTETELEFAKLMLSKFPKNTI